MQALPLTDGALDRAPGDGPGDGDRPGDGDGDREGFLADAVPSPLAQIMLARARRRAAVPLDVVTFVAACPGCGRDCEWTQVRQETRVRSTVDCPCRG